MPSFKYSPGLQHSSPMMMAKSGSRAPCTRAAAVPNTIRAMSLRSAKLQHARPLWLFGYVVTCFSMSGPALGLLEIHLSRRQYGTELGVALALCAAETSLTLVLAISTGDAARSLLAPGALRPLAVLVAVAAAMDRELPPHP